MGNGLKKRRREVVIEILVIIMCAIGLVLPQLYRQGLILGMDISFQYNRFYEVYMQLRTGHWNFFQSIFGFDQSGRIVNAVYGNGLAYLGGGLLLFLHDWFKFQVVMAFLCELTAGLTMLLFMRRLRVRAWVATGGAVLYMSAFVVNTWILNQSVTGWGAALLPLVFVSGSAMVTAQRKGVNAILLGATVALLVMTHLVSALLGIVALVPFFIVGLVHRQRRLQLLSRTAIAVVIAIVLAGSSLLAILTLQSSNHLYTPWHNDKMLDATANLSTGDNGMITIGLIFSVLFVFQIILVLTSWRRRTTLERVITMTGAVFLVVSSKLFPWASVAKQSEFMAGLQFPWRFSVIACILLIAGFGLTLDRWVSADPQRQEVLRALYCTGAVLMMMTAVTLIDTRTSYWATDNPTGAGDNAPSMHTTKPKEIRAIFANPNLLVGIQNLQRPNSDYLPLPAGKRQHKHHGYVRYDREIIHNPLKVTKQITPEHALQLTWRQKRAATVTVPVIIYAHSVIHFNGRTVRPEQMKKTDIGAARVKAQPGENTITVGYQQPRWLSVVLGLQVIAWLGVLLYALRVLVAYLIP
ncbi:MAG: hypothetical protein LKJ69_01865 [Lactobacillus sp.]|nr:hypothetical protein [Lactobacillus sp.]MCI2032127.1 hypothetical protein [Lactobacillus sp.]